MVKAVSGLIVVIMVAMGITLNSTEVLAAEFIIEPLDYDFPTEIEDAASDGKNLVVMFHKNGCPYCDKMHKRVFPHPKVSKLYNEKFIMIIVNMSGDLDVITPKGETKSEKEFASKLLVRATPVFMFYGKDGSDALRLTGYQDPEMFTAAGKYISDGVFKDGTSFINYVRSMN
ncbi:MAG: thioredoxin family protein [Rhodospirillaceae bacterium]|nr:thioredoxin family protein [Rhodospirillaceae bacterium]